MNFNLNEALDMLSRTPHMLESLLSGLSHDWLHSREGEEHGIQLKSLNI